MARLIDVARLIDGVAERGAGVNKQSDLEVIPIRARFANEAELAERVLTVLEPHFEVERKVSGRHCSGRRLQIDAVLRPRDPSAWKDDNPAFGVEFKLAHQGAFSTYEFTQWARQAVDYTHVEWNGYGPLYVFACSSPIPASDGDNGWLMAHLLGQFGVGELCPRDKTVFEPTRAATERRAQCGPRR